MRAVDDDEPKAAEGLTPWLPTLPEAEAPVVDHLLAYVAGGMELMPRRLDHNGRLIDLLSGSPRTGLRSETQIRRWLATHPAPAGWAVVTGPESGVLVIDLDRHPGGDDGLATMMRELEQQHALLPAPPVVLSPTQGGRHLYFRWPRGPVRSSGAIAPGIEVIADRGACTLPPSRKAAGLYRWSLARHPAHLPLPELPRWLLAMIRPPAPPPRPRRPASPPAGDRRERYARAALEAEAATVARAAGMVDCTLNRSAWNLGRFVAAGEVDHHEVEDVLIAAAVAAGHPEGRARRTVQGAIRRRRTSP
jgi:hypothetical protein